MNLISHFLLLAQLACICAGSNEKSNAGVDEVPMSMNEPGFGVSSKAMAGIIVSVLVLLIGAFGYCYYRKQGNMKIKKQVEMQQVKWFENQQAQLKTPQSKSSVVNLTCSSVPVATFSGKLTNRQPRCCKIPIVNLDSDSESFQFDSPRNIQDTDLKEDNVPLCKTYSSKSLESPHLEFEVLDSPLSRYHSNCSLEISTTKATVEFTATSQL